MLADGLILSSQAQLAASLRADWDPLRLDVARRLLRILEARARARRTATLTWPAEADAAARAAVDGLAAAGATARPFGVLISGRDVFDVTAALADGGRRTRHGCEPDLRVRGRERGDRRTGAAAAAVKLTAPSTNDVHLHNELTASSKIHPVVFDWLANMPPIGGGRR